MKQSKLLDLAQLIFRLAAGFSFFYYGSDRVGLWGAYGGKYVSWGDWNHFMAYASQVMSFLPYSVAQVFAAIATAAEISFGLLLMIGFKTKWVALGAALLSALFAISMTISFGIFKPLAYSVYVISAASLMVYCLEDYKWSLDSIIKKMKNEKVKVTNESFS